MRTARFTVEAGVMVRGEIRRQIESAAWRAGLDIEVVETKGLFESLYRFKITGDPDVVTRFTRRVDGWLSSQ